MAGSLVSVVMLVPAPVCLVVGWFSKRLLRRGATGRTARVLPMVVALAIGGILTLGFLLRPDNASRTFEAVAAPAR